MANFVYNASRFEIFHDFTTNLTGNAWKKYWKDSLCDVEGVTENIVVYVWGAFGTPHLKSIVK